MKKRNFLHKLAAVVTTGSMLAGSTDAFAQNTLNTVLGNTVNNTSGMVNTIQTVAYVAGAGLGVTGVFKLKQHVDNPGQTPLKGGLMNLAAGGSLLAMPFLMQTMQGTVANNQGGQLGGASVSSLNTALQGGTSGFLAP